MDSSLIERIRKTWVDDKGRFVPYQPIDHPSLKHHPTVQPCIERLKIIKPHLPKLPSTILDLGSHTGWFCRRLEELGYNCIGFEYRELEVEISNSIPSPCEGRPGPVYVCCNILGAEIPKVDAVLCLSVAMYLFDDPDKGWRTMQRISSSSKKLFLEVGGKYASKVPFSEGNTVSAILAKTSFTRAMLLGRSDLNRPMFLFERD